jgi:hypothetical protein
LSITLLVLSPRALRAADPSSATSPTIATPAVTAPPAASETIEVPERKAAGGGGEPADLNPALADHANTAQIPQTSASPDTGLSWQGDPVVIYEHAQNPPSPYGPGIGSAEDFMLEGEDAISPLGLRLRTDRRKLKSGETATGLLVVDVTSGGPAARAGVKPYRHSARSAIEAASVAGAFFFPPAMMLLPVLESTQVGDSYDMIVGVDGFRVTSPLDFEDCMRDLQPGEIVYLSLVRNGTRVQLPVPVPNFIQ